MDEIIYKKWLYKSGVADPSLKWKRVNIKLSDKGVTFFKKKKIHLFLKLTDIKDIYLEKRVVRKFSSYVGINIYTRTVLYTFSNVNTNHSIHVTFVSTVQKYALIIGISDYKTVTDLNYPDEDANAWYSYFSSKNYLIWVLGDNTNSYSQFNRTATEKNINETIQKIISLADYNDEVALTFSGHGDGDGNGSSYIFAWDANSGEEGYDGFIDDFELDYYLADLRADKLFIFLDACNSGGMNETMNNSNINHIFMTTTSTENGLGWDEPAFQLGAWTHFFLTQGLNNTNHENWNFTSVFLYAYDEYHTFYGDGGTWDGPTRWDHPVYYNSKENKPFFLS